MKSNLLEYKKTGNIVILGAGGFVGKAVVNSLKGFEGEIIAPSSSELNLLDLDAVKQFCQASFTPDTSVIYIAARMPYTSIPRDDFEAMFDNVSMTKNLIVGLLDNPVAELILASTIDVYKLGDDLITEDTLTQPYSNYSTTKLCAEVMLFNSLKKVNIPFLNLRLSHMFGVSDTSPKAIFAFIKQAISKKHIQIQGDGLASRDFVDVEDVGLIFRESIGRGLNDTINVVKGNSITIAQLAETIQSISEEEVSITYTNSTKANTHYNFDNKKLHKYYPDMVFKKFYVSLREVFEHHLIKETDNI